MQRQIEFAGVVLVMFAFAASSVVLAGCGKGNQAQTDAAKDSAGKDAGGNKDTAAKWDNTATKEKLFGKWSGKLRIDRAGITAALKKTNPAATDADVQSRYSELYDTYDLEPELAFNKDGTFESAKNVETDAYQGTWEASDASGPKITATIKKADGTTMVLKIQIQDAYTITAHNEGYHPEGVEWILVRANP